MQFSPSFLPNPRQLLLLKLLHAQKSMHLEELAHTLKVTLQTVRRDVQKLADEGLLVRFHGGVQTPNAHTSTIENMAHVQRQALFYDEKQRIAQEVARQIPNNCSLTLNLGTTTEAVARALHQHKGLRVITNNLNAAIVLSANPDCEIIITGGIVRPHDRGIIGEPTIEFIRQFKVDIAVIGISGIEEDGTLRDFDYHEVKVTQAIIEHARQVWLATDVSKFNRAAMVEVAKLEQIHHLFVDQMPPETFVPLLEKAHIKLSIASNHTVQNQPLTPPSE